MIPWCTYVLDRWLQWISAASLQGKPAVNVVGWAALVVCSSRHTNDQRSREITWFMPNSSLSAVCVLTLAACMTPYSVAK